MLKIEKNKKTERTIQNAGNGVFANLSVQFAGKGVFVVIAANPPALPIHPIVWTHLLYGLADF